MQSQNGIIVEVQELMGGNIELILHRLVDEGSQIGLMGFTVGNYVNRNSLQHEKPRRIGGKRKEYNRTFTIEPI